MRKRQNPNARSNRKMKTMGISNETKGTIYRNNAQSVVSHTETLGLAASLVAGAKAE